MTPNVLESLSWRAESSVSDYERHKRVEGEHAWSNKSMDRDPIDSITTVRSTDEETAF
jgi:hypothetical protein